MYEVVLPFHCSLDSSDTYAKGSPLKGRESKLQASSASYNQQQLPNLALTLIITVSKKSETKVPLTAELTKETKD